MSQESSLNIRFDRLHRLIGTEGLNRLSGAYVTIVGLGAVGSFALEALARSGIGHLRLVDFDIIHSSNINRQLLALESTLGMEKTAAAKARVLDINPTCQVETLTLKIDKNHIAPLFNPCPDIILDAIDILSGKITLMTESAHRGIPLVCSMGAARRTDPTLIRTASFAKVTGCPLAKQLRKELKKLGLCQITSSIPTVYSSEKSTPVLLKNTFSSDTREEEYSSGKAPLPSLITVTAAFGLNLANLALKHLLSPLK